PAAPRAHGPAAVAPAAEMQASAVRRWRGTPLAPDEAPTQAPSRAPRTPPPPPGGGPAEGARGRESEGARGRRVPDSVLSLRHSVFGIRPSASVLRIPSPPPA